jgi:pyruvate dehydrogenase E2 component (dihydrolipoamide acetyltransferase)
MAAGVKGDVRVVEPDRAQRTLARRAAETRATVPDVELGAEVEVGGLLRRTGEHPDALTAAIVRACALALRAWPRANAAYRDGRFELYSRVNVGVVLAGGDGLPTGTLFDADAKGVEELAEELRELRARAAGLTSPERSGATFTVQVLGGVTRASPLIAAPQAAALAACGPRAAAVVSDGALAPGQLLDLTLACDSRILYGAQAEGFLVSLAELLARGELS